MEIVRRYDGPVVERNLKRCLFLTGRLQIEENKEIVIVFQIYTKLFIGLKSATTRLYDTEAKIICIVSKKGAQCIECHHKDI